MRKIRALDTKLLRIFVPLIETLEDNMNLLLIVVPILSFILFGSIVAIVAPFKIFSTIYTDHFKRELSFAIFTFLVLPVLIITSLMNYQLHHNLNSDFHNVVRVGGILDTYIFTVSPVFLVVAVLVKASGKEGFKLLLWGSLFLTFTLPLVLVIFGVPIGEFFVNMLWDEGISVRKIVFH